MSTTFLEYSQIEEKKKKEKKRKKKKEKKKKKERFLATKSSIWLIFIEKIVNLADFKL